MMKKIIILFLGSLLLQACEHTEPPQTKLKIFFLVDSVSKDMANALNTLLKPYKKKPSKYKLLSVSLCQSGMDDNQEPACADFKFKDTDKNRTTAFRRFMDPVDELTKNEYKDCNLLHLINRICNEINDTAMVYRIYIDSKMIENSTVYSPANNDNQVNGHYQFVNADGEVNSSEIIQASKHLSDSTSWIYRHLVALKKENPIIKKCKVYIQIYMHPQIANGAQKHTASSGKDDLDIKNFWKALFNMIGIPYEMNPQSSINIGEIKDMIAVGKTEEIK